MIATGSQIRAARAGLGWTRAELAGRAGICAKTVQYWEPRGMISPRQAQGWALEKMVAAFNAAGVDVVAEPRPAVLF